jgi:Smr domain
MITANSSSGVSAASNTWGSSSGDDNNNNITQRRPSVVAATAAAVDAYAQSVLELHSTPGHEPDDSLGSYVTSLIRCHGNNEGQQKETTRMVAGGGGGGVREQQLPEFDSLIELIHEHCNISPEQAENVLEQITTAVQTGEIPNPNSDWSNTTAISGQQQQQHYCTTDDLIQSMNLLSATSAAEAAERSNNTKDHQPSITSSTTTSAATHTPDSDGGEGDYGTGSSVGITVPPSRTMEVSNASSSTLEGLISPIRADNLIPIDLMGVLDDPSTPKAGGARVGGGRLISVETRSTSAQLMPVLPAPPTPPRNNSSQKKLTSQQERQRLAQDIAASLFQPTTITTSRSRQSSIDESRVQTAASSSSSSANTTNTTSSPNSTTSNNLSPNLSPNLHAMTPGSTSGGSDSSLYHQHDVNAYYQEQQQQQHEWNMIMDMLLIHNPDLSEEAASAAAYLSSTYLLEHSHGHHNHQQQHYYDVNVAQYLIDCAMPAPPVCRHLLNDGCYRSDCTYSHDIDAHVCLFWLRGRCRRGNNGDANCRFLHGFDEKVLQDIDPSLLIVSENNNRHLSTYDEHHQGSSSVYEEDANYGSSSSSSDYGLPPPAIASHYPPASSAWKSEAPGPRAASMTTTAPSFANIASQGYQTAASSFATTASSPSFAAPTANSFSTNTTTTTTKAAAISSNNARKVDIPQDLWNAHENRDSSVFYIADPIERYHAVSAASLSSSMTTMARQPQQQQQQCDNIIDLHFQSTKTFGIVLESILPTKLERHLLQQQQDYYKKSSGSSSSSSSASSPPGVWIVTGTGHHVGSKTHQKGGGALEQAVLEWLTEHGYDFLRGRDRNGQGGAVLVTSKRKKAT